MIIETFIVFEHNIFLNFPILLLETIELENKIVPIMFSYFAACFGSVCLMWATFQHV